MLIRLLSIVSNGLNARQAEIFTKMPLKGSLKFIEYKILNMRYRNVKPFQKLFGTIFPNILKYILPGCRLPVRSQMDQMPYSKEFLPKWHWKLHTNLLSIFDVKNILKHIKNLLCTSSENLSTKSTTLFFGIAWHFWTKIWHTLEVSRHHLVALRWKFLTAGL